MYESVGPSEGTSQQAIAQRLTKDLPKEGRTHLQKKEVEGKPHENKTARTSWVPPGPLARTASSESKRKASASMSRVKSGDTGDGLDRPERASDRLEPGLDRLERSSGDRLGKDVDRPERSGGDPSSDDEGTHPVVAGRSMHPEQVVVTGGKG
jgi:hypothetical protein